MSKPKAHVSDEKKEVVKQLSKLIAEYPIVGLVDMENLPSPQLQKMKQLINKKSLLI